jgi:hypothetical protein
MSTIDFAHIATKLRRSIMTTKSGQETGRLFDILVRGRNIDRELVIASLIKPESVIDYTQLRVMIVQALTNDFLPKDSERKQNYKFDRDSRAIARSWLLSALARIGEVDPESRSLTRKHLDPNYEPNRWARNEVLAGLFTAKASDLVELANTVIKNDQEPWPYMLAVAILASNGDPNALEEMKQKLHEKTWHVATLRALRTIPIEELVNQVLEMARKGDYDAVVALGYIPNTWPEVSDAAEVLWSVIKGCHKHHWKTDLWGKALKALGNLKLSVTSPWLIDELINDNPNIIFEAAVALEKVLGTSTAVVRVVEAAASNVESTFIETYASALRWMDRNLVIEKLEEIMVSGLVEHQETARILLIAIGGLSAFQKVQARRAAITQYMDQLQLAEIQIKELFESSIGEAQKGFKLAAYMDMAVFTLGIVLILVSAILALIKQGNLDSWAGVGLASGGAGVLGILYALLKDPRRQIKDEVDHLMHLKVLFLGYLRQLHQADQAYTRRLLEDQQLTVTELQEFSNLVGTTMQSAVAGITHSDLPIKEAKPETKSTH